MTNDDDADLLPDWLGPSECVTPSDTEAMLAADLASLPPLPRWAFDMLLYGGHNPQHPPAEVVGGKSWWKQRNRLGDGPPELLVSSAESTFSLINACLKAGWSREECEAILTRRPAVGGRWLHWTSDAGAFDRAWSKAEWMRDHPRRRRRKTFVSYPGDRWKVWTGAIVKTCGSACHATC